MTRDETKKIVMIIASTYPNWHPADMSLTVDAWSLVSNALRRSTYYAESEFEKLPEIVQKAVGSPSMLRNWAQTDMQSVENVVQSNFMRTYRQEITKNREKRKIPQNVIKALEQSDNRLIEDK